MGFDKTIDKLEQDDFDRLLFYLEEERGLSQSSLRNYRKLAKKLYGWVFTMMSLHDGLKRLNSRP